MRVLAMNERKSEKGATLVEFALVMPVFFLLLFGVIDFGRYFFVQHTLQYGTREGTRLALVGKQLTDPNNPSQLLSRLESIKKMIKDSVAMAVNPNDVVISVYPVDPPNYSDKADGTLDAGEPGDYMRVKTQYTYRFLTPFISVFFSGGVNTIQSQATYRNELFS
jgi:hypothetical protein